MLNTETETVETFPISSTNPFSFRGRERLKSLAILIPTGITDFVFKSNFQLNDFLIGYGHDTIGGFASFFFIKLSGPLPSNTKYNTLMGFGLMSLTELLQGLGLEKGTFDWADFLAYAAGTTTAAGVNHLLSRQSHK